MATAEKSLKANVGRYRYFLLAIIFFLTVVNYADRAIISIAGPAISDEFGLSAIELGFIFSAFGWSYVIGQLPGGWLLDRFGTKWVYAACVGIWSLFTLLQGFVFGAAAVALLFTLRLLVGLSEAPSFPANSRVVSMWFPAQERGLAAAIFNSAQYLATVLFAPLMGWVVYTYGWREVFWLMGGIGIIAMLVWLKVFRTPHGHAAKSSENNAELEHILEGGALVDIDEVGDQQKKPSISWSAIKQLLTSRMLIGVYLAQYCIVTLTWFFLTWFPVYLVQERGFNILQAGFVAVLPALCGFLGGILGGIISDQLFRKTGSLTLARKTPIIIGMLLATTMIICNYVDSPVLVVGLMTLAFFGKGLGALGWAVVTDTSPKELPGLNAGLFNTFGNVAGITTPIAIGYLVEMNDGSFTTALVFVAVNAVVAIFSYLFLVGEIKRIKLQPDKAG